jgi:hypothetical protein
MCKPSAGTAPGCPGRERSRVEIVGIAVVVVVGIDIVAEAVEVVIAAGGVQAEEIGVVAVGGAVRRGGTRPGRFDGLDNPLVQAIEIDLPDEIGHGLANWGADDVHAALASWGHSGDLSSDRAGKYARRT